MPVLVSVNLAQVRHDAWTGKLGRSGIDKRPVQHPVRIADDAVAGDTICDRRHHGSPDQAVYAYAQEDAQFWAHELGRPVTDGSFGENLTTSGLDVSGALIGERWAIGTVVLEVAGPRIPCSTFAGFWGVPKLVKLFTAAARPGAYLRIVTPGEVRAGQPITITRAEEGLTLADSFRALMGDRELAARAVAAGWVTGPLYDDLAAISARAQIT